MRGFYKHFIFVLAWFSWRIMPAVPLVKNEYRTDLLETIAKKTALQQRLDTLDNGLYIEYVYYKSIPITTIVENHRVTHIGYSFFSPEQRNGLGIEVCNFLERYSLELDIPINESLTTEERLKQDHVTIQGGHFRQLRSLCNDSTIRISLHIINEKGYVMSWHRDTTWLCSVSFPIEYDLLFGTNMDERERRLPEELLREDSVEWDSVFITEKDRVIKAWQDNYYTLKGDIYLMDNLNSHHYFEKDSTEKFRPIFDKNYPIESLTNLFTSNLIENDYILDIRFHKYGFKTDTINVTLRRWISYCRQTGCKAFFGVIRLDKDKMATCELVMHNSIMGYNHIMKLTFPYSCFEKREGHISARLNSYITCSRIKSLFEENNQLKKK